MKKIIVFLVTILTVQLIYCQKTVNKPDREDKDQKSKKKNISRIKYYNLDSEIEQIKYGTPLRIIVKNINPFLTQNFVTHTPINFDFSTDAFSKIDIKKEKVIEKNKTKDLSNIKISQYAEFSADLLNTLSEKSANLFNLVEKESSKPEEIEKIKKEIAYLKKEIDKLNNKIKKEIGKNNVLQKKYDSIYNVTKKSIEFKTAFKQFQNHFNSINKYTSLRGLLLTQINKDSVFINDVKNFKNRATSNFEVIYNDSINHLAKKSNINTKLADLQATYLTLQQKYQELNKLYKNDKLILSGELKTKNKKSSLKFDKVTTSLETEYLYAKEMSKAKAINDSLIKPENKRKLISEAYEGVDLYDEIINRQYKDTLISKNIYSDSAEIKFELKNNKGKVVHKFNPYIVKTYGRIKINGSAGYFVNFTTDDNYTLRKKVEGDADSKTGVVKSQKDRIKSALGGLLHVYCDIKGDVDLGISAGLSVNEDSNTAFYLGGSVLFTEKNRLVFTTGLSFLKVNKLNKANLSLENGLYNFINESDPEIKYDNVYKPSFFVGISYNIFK